MLGKLLRPGSKCGLGVPSLVTRRAKFVPHLKLAAARLQLENHQLSARKET